MNSTEEAKHTLGTARIEYSEYTDDAEAIIFESGLVIRGPFSKDREANTANARHIVKASNCHDELVAALSQAEETLSMCPQDRRHRDHAIVDARAILAKAEKEE